MALSAEILGLTVLNVAVSAFQGLAVMRRDVRIRRLEVLGLFSELIGVVATCTRVNVGRSGIRFVRTVTGFALHADLRVSISAKRGCLYGDSRCNSGEHDEQSRRKSHVEKIGF